MACVDDDDNELIVLETIHHFVEVRVKRKAIAIREAHAPLLLLLQSSLCAHTSLRLFSSLQVLDRYFGNVCELDLIFNFHKAYHILDELLICGELQEPSKKAILRVTAAQDALMEGSGDSKVSDSKYEI